MNLDLKSNSSAIRIRQYRNTETENAFALYVDIHNLRNYVQKTCQQLSRYPLDFRLTHELCSSLQRNKNLTSTHIKESSFVVICYLDIGHLKWLDLQKEESTPCWWHLTETYLKILHSSLLPNTAYLVLTCHNPLPSILNRPLHTA